ncbi:DUF637 domain-containing protein, partial [Ralstonia solanacearum]
ASQVLTTGKVNMGQVIKAGVVAVVTAGLTQGALSALNVSSVGASTIGNNISTGNWAAAQSSLGSYLEGAVVHSAISAGVSTVAYGGSFGQAFANGMVQSAAALGANAIGAEIPGIGMANASASSIALNVASHALLGCAAASLSGNECAGGAIGGAVSALVANPIAAAVTNGQGHPTDAQLAAITALSMIAGGGVAAALGHDALSAGTAAQNEVLNNTCGSEDPNGCGKKYAAAGAVVGGAITATASVGVDVATGGLNILATPAEVAGGSALGGTVGGLYGAFLDGIEGGRPLFSSGNEGDAAATGDAANGKAGDDGAGEPRAGEKGGQGSGKDFSEKIKDKVRERDGYKCVFCKIETTNKPGPDRSEIDHAESKKNGGNNSENNGQNTCRTCNRQKGGKSTVEYLDWLKKLLGN